MTHIKLKANATNGCWDSIKLLDLSDDLRSDKIVHLADGNYVGQSTFNKEDTIYVIHHDFDLNNQTITIPKDCTLKFEGGSLRNFNQLIGQNTSIEVTGNYHVLHYDRETQKIDGTWLHEKWNVIWFGAKPDGYARRGDWNDDFTIFTEGKNPGYDVKFYGTDNFDSIQKALDTCFFTNIVKVYVPSGFYRISKGLNMGWDSNGYNTMILEGSSHKKIGDISFQTYNANSSAILVDNTNYGININGGIGSRLANIGFYGLNSMTTFRMSVMSQNEVIANDTSVAKNFYTDKIEGWNSPYVFNELSTMDFGLGKYDAYIGISTDAFIGHHEIDQDNLDHGNNYRKRDLPIPPAGITFNQAKNSTKVELLNVHISGFSVGYGICSGNWSDNAEFYRMNNINIDACVYAISNGSNQSRTTSMNSSNIHRCGIAITDRIGGTPTSTGTSYYFKIQNSSFDGCYELINIKKGLSIFTFDNCYCENSYRLGVWSSPVISQQDQPLILKNCTFRFLYSINNPFGIPTTVFDGNTLIIKDSIFRNSEGLPFTFSTRYLKIDDSKFLTNNDDKTPIKNVHAINTFYNYVDHSRFSLTTNENLDGDKLISKELESGVIKKMNVSSDLNLQTTNRSFNSTTRLLTFTFTDITKGSVRTINVGDVVGDKFGKNIIGIVKNVNYTTNEAILFVVGGIRKLDTGEYVLINDINEGNYDIHHKSTRWFNKPLKVEQYNNDGSNTTIKLIEWNSILQTGLYLNLRVNDSIELNNLTYTDIIEINEIERTIKVRNDVKNINGGYIFSYWKEDSKDWWSDFTNIYDELNS
ncbi:hypothetical protein [Wenyingzhuangia sp. IMCC45574]